MSTASLDIFIFLLKQFQFIKRIISFMSFDFTVANTSTKERLYILFSFFRVFAFLRAKALAFLLLLFQEKSGIRVRHHFFTAVGLRTILLFLPFLIQVKSEKAWLDLVIGE